MQTEVPVANRVCRHHCVCGNERMTESSQMAKFMKSDGLDIVPRGSVARTRLRALSDGESRRRDLRYASIARSSGRAYRNTCP